MYGVLLLSCFKCNDLVIQDIYGYLRIKINYLLCVPVNCKCDCVPNG